MKVLGFNRNLGDAKVKVDTLDDLWHLSKIIGKGDLVSGKSTRKVKLYEASERQKAVKRSVFVELKVEEVELGGHLKVRGSVQNEVEDIPLHSSHSLEVELGTTIDIHKDRWREFEIRRLEEAEEASAAPKALVCVLDDESASLAFLTAAGFTLQGEMKLRLSKKLFEEKNRKPQDDIDKLIGKIKGKAGDDIEVIILGSPLFWKEIVYNRIKELYPKFSKRIHLEDTSSGDEKGIRELVTGGTLDKITKQSQAARESQFVNHLLQEISKTSKLVAYKYGTVSKLAKDGAVAQLLITDSKMQELREDALELIDGVENLGGEVHIINSKGDAGRKLNGLGGVGAVLRYA